MNATTNFTSKSMTDYSYFMIAPRTSAVRVFGKSMHALAAGWLASIVWLWIAQLQQHITRQGEMPPGYELNTLILGVLPAALISLGGILINSWAGPAPDQSLERREWWHAFVWSVVPTALFLATVWVMIQESR